MSVLSQFFSCDGGKPVVANAAGFDIMVEKIYSIKYSPSEGWYYLMTSVPTLDSTDNFGATMWVSRDGKNFYIGSRELVAGTSSTILEHVPNPTTSGFILAYDSGASSDTRFNIANSYGDILYVNTATSGVPYWDNLYGSGYYLTGSRYYIIGLDSPNNAVAYSSDGKNWTTSTSGLTTNNIRSFSSRGYTDAYIGATSGVVQKSTNGGASWTTLTNIPGNPDVESICAGAVGSGSLFAEGYYSTNDGNTWQASTGWPGGWADFITYNAASDRFVATGEYSSGDEDIHYAIFSEDGGANWQVISDPIIRTQLISAAIGSRSIASSFNTNIYALVSCDSNTGQAAGSRLVIIDPATL